MELSKITYTYKIMYQDCTCKNGWLEAGESLAGCPKVFDTESGAYDAADRLWGCGMLEKYKIVRIGSVE